MREMASCVLDAMRAGGSAQAPPPDLKLGNPPLALPNLFFSERVGSCATIVHERIGLPPAVQYELRLQGSTFEFGARVVPE